VVLQGPQADAPITVWVKRMDVTGAQYAAVKGVDLQQTVDDFKARWIAQAKLDVDPSLVALRLVRSSAADPTPDEEAIAKNKAEDLSPRLTLAAAGLTDGCSLLAFVVGTRASAEHFTLSTNVSGACTACIPLHPFRFAHHSASVAAAALRLADYALLEESSEHKDVFYLGPRGSGPRAFFVDAELKVTSQGLRWLKTVRSKWVGVMTANDDTAVSMTITGTPKVCLGA
jgi:hypothetical protein